MVRVRSRYLLFEIQLANQAQVLVSRMETNVKQIVESSNNFVPSEDSQLNDRNIQKAIRNSIQYMFGDAGSSKVMKDINVKYFNPDTHLGLLRTSRDHFRMIWASMTLINSIQGMPCSIRVIHVSGTIKTCQLITKRYNRKILMNLAGLLNQSKALLKITIPENSEEIPLNDAVEVVKKFYKVPEIQADSED